MNGFIDQLASGGHFQGYAYGYPHKTTYRPLDTPVPLADAWSAEDKRNLFLYLHVPFCEMRCAFCNLFTTTHPGAGLVTGYLNALEVQAERMRAALGPGIQVARLAVGGGTPTFLKVAELEKLFSIVRGFSGWNHAACSVELSPATVTSGKLQLLKASG